jgi:hypothetical protein
VLAAIHFAFEVHRSASWGVSISLQMQQSIALGGAAPVQDPVPNDLRHRAESCGSNSSSRVVDGGSIGALSRIPSPVSLRVPVLFDRYLSNTASASTVDAADMMMIELGSSATPAPFAVDLGAFTRRLREAGLFEE